MKYFLKKNWQMIQSYLTRISMFPRIKPKPNKVEIKIDKKNSNEKPIGIQYYECYGYDHYAHECANWKKGIKLYKLHRMIQTIPMIRDLMMIK